MELLRLIALGWSRDRILERDPSFVEADFLAAAGFVVQVWSAKPEKSYRVTDVRKAHAKAYAPWTAADDAALVRAWQSGQSSSAIAEMLGRKVGAIQSRLRKLGLEN
jgi:DNA-directed RNA polymerase specialized sigma24 family protein